LDKYLEIVEENQEKRKNHAKKIEEYQEKLLKLTSKIVEVKIADPSIANSTTYVNQICSKLFKKGPLKETKKENTILHRCELRLPTTHDKLKTILAIGISPNQKSGEESPN
jgi:ribosomal protein S4